MEKNIWTFVPGSPILVIVMMPWFDIILWTVEIGPAIHQGQVKDLQCSGDPWWGTL